MRSWKAPTEAEVDRALTLAARSQQRRYLFERLENPLWLKPLQARGVFQHPTAPEASPDGKSVRFPPWPPARYLVKAAPYDPNLAVEIALQVPDNGNVSVHEDLVDVALALPPNVAARLSKKAQIWAQSPYQWLLPEKLSKFVTHLAQGGETTAALALARQLLAVVADPSADERGNVPQDVLVPEPRARVDHWRYEQLLKETVPEFVVNTGIEGLRLVRDLLENAIRLSLKADARASSNDYSYIWRPAIEDNEQNDPDGVQALLTVALRDAAETLASKSSVSLESILDELARMNRPVYARVSLHLLRLYADRVPDRIAQALVNRSNFDSTALRHEYTLLSSDRFGQLDTAQQQEILGWIAAGSDRDRIIAYEKERRGTTPTAEEVDRIVRLRQRDRLAPIEKFLPPEWKTTFSNLLAELGPPAHPEFLIYSEGFRWGSESPLSEEDLEEQTVEQIVGYLNSWKPTPFQTWAGPSPEGLAEALRLSVRQRAPEFSSEAASFEDVHPTYIRALLSGLNDAAKEGAQIDWAPVLRLAAAQIEQHQRRIPVTVIAEGDPSREWSLSSALDLVEAGIDKGQVATDLRREVWQVIESLAKSQRPTADPTDISGIRGVTIAINSLPGRAIQVALKYTKWLATREVLDLKRSFEETPEVAELLDNLLSPALATPPIQALFGMLVPTLQFLDSEWVSRSRSAIFPSDREDIRRLAWQSFVSFSSPSRPLFDLLRDEYGWAIRQFGQFKSERGYGEADDRLAEHLVMLYLWGIVALDNDLLDDLYAFSAPAVRAHAMEFLGRTLYNTASAVPAKPLERAQALWQKRRDVERANARGMENEQSKFGWLCASGKFDDLWSLNELISVLKKTRQIDPAFLVARRLTELAAKYPEQVMQALEMLVEADERGPGIHGWRHDARRLLEIAMSSSNSEARRLATKTIHRLGEAGYQDYRELLGIIPES